MPTSVRMVPGAFDAYLGAAATASAALIGLLFVAVSVRDDSIFGPKATPGGEALRARPRPPRTFPDSRIPRLSRGRGGNLRITKRRPGATAEDHAKRGRIDLGRPSGRHGSYRGRSVSRVALGNSPCVGLFGSGPKGRRSHLRSPTRRWLRAGHQSNRELPPIPTRSSSSAPPDQPPDRARGGHDRQIRGQTVRGCP
jgi:hypothetical protein